eukprot:Pgem_evm1s11141
MQQKNKENLENKKALDKFVSCFHQAGKANHRFVITLHPKDENVKKYTINLVQTLLELIQISYKLYDSNNYNNQRKLHYNEGNNNNNNNNNKTSFKVIHCSQNRQLFSKNDFYDINNNSILGCLDALQYQNVSKKCVGSNYDLCIFDNISKLNPEILWSVCGSIRGK